MDSALLLVDVQNDFCPGGALAVPAGDQIVPVLNAYIDRFATAGLPIIASRDWHPAETRHFQAGGGPWPPHCVAGTEGAAFHPALRLPQSTTVVTKGTDPTDDGYSAFEATDPRGRPLTQALAARGITRLFVGGLATDYCVRASVMDALKKDFDVVLLVDAIRGIDLKPGDVDRALDEMVGAGARTATLETVNEELAA